MQILLALTLLLINMGVSSLAGFALLVLAVPALAWVVKTLAAKRRGMNKITDERVALTGEVLMGVRFVKFFGWEGSFLERLGEMRWREVRAVQFLLGVRSGVNALGMVSVFESLRRTSWKLTLGIVNAGVCEYAGVHHVLAHG